jgi:hypothetical protein
LLGAGRAAEAAPVLKSVVEQNRSFDTDNALLALARALYGAGDLPAARASFEELAERRARPEILYDLAMVQGLLGDRAAAMRSLQRIVDDAELVPDYLKREVRPWVRKARGALSQLGR